MEKTIALQDSKEMQVLFGVYDRKIRAFEKQYRVKVITRDDTLKLSGSSINVKKAQRVVKSFLDTIREGKNDEFCDSSPRASSKQDYPHKHNNIAPKTKHQREYVEAIKKYDIVFSVGPAGTGKTYLAVWQAKEALGKGEVRRIILTRPAIEAGEKLGFLPGDMYEKISPYLRPLYDALYDMMDADIVEKYLNTGIIEVVPLAYMRGRTLNDAFIILDEAQNCTAEQMKMFLTRLGFDSKAVITGDITQSDLPAGRPAGLIQARELFEDIDGIKFIHLTGSDIVRHELVQKIIEAYEKAANKK